MEPGRQKVDVSCGWRRVMVLKKCLILTLAWLAVVFLFGGAGSATNSVTIEVLRVDGNIVPAVASYIDRGISQAEAKGAEGVIIELSTPGGLLSTTESIVDRILKAEVPVVVYVDRWAGSAGTFIALAAHVAAMAPGSRIGAATPVAVGEDELSEALAKKITEDTRAMIRGLAILRERNVAAAEATVVEALSFTDGEALGTVPLPEHQQELLGLETPYLDPPLVDVGAESIDQLISTIHGMRVEVAGVDVTINTEDYSGHEKGMTIIERFLQAISDPNIAYILLSLAIMALFLELANPGIILPGVVGAVSLILAFYSLAVLEAYWAGILLIVLGPVLFVAEVFTPTFGILTLGGIVALVMGSLILFGIEPELFQLQLDWWAIALVVSVVTAVFVFVIGAIIRSQRRQPATGKEGLVGKTGIAHTELSPSGLVVVEGERWAAISESERVEQGAEVVVTRFEGLQLRVRAK